MRALGAWAMRNSWVKGVRTMEKREEEIAWLTSIR